MNSRNLMTAIVEAVLFSAMATVALAQRRSLARDRGKLPALMGGNFSTAASRLARSMATDPSVRRFTELKIAKQATVAKPFRAEPGTYGMRPYQAAIVEQMTSARGRTFDRMYTDGHREPLDIQRRNTRNSLDPTVRGASIVSATCIETHVMRLRGLRRQVG